ncbi:MAG: ATP-dependent acyl-CoA ligase [Acidimicrobiaceae bacterium]|nr:ATP-dependent acyl-CoA ligase [Acidimicrobiaceae bacterium]MYB87210.1 ATP-dependent acyl-CoA ligase [Acidimicrobiaceae bacterium]MYH92490.1 ATP-dependent acyl-CoA ligase [Acidimicrobiaceae bacterium]
MSTWAEPVSFASVWDRAVSGRADETFLIFETPSGDVSRWSYGDFDEAVDRVAGTLVALGAEPGAAVHLALTNSPTFVAAWLAASRLGAWIVPSDPMGRAPELAGHIERTRPTVGLCAGDRADVYRAAVAAAGRMDLPVIEIDEADTTLAPFDATPLAVAERPEAGLRDRAAVMFTSGTTGRPKGVEVTQANYAFAGKVMAEAAGLAPEDRQLVVLPLFHANAQYYSFASAIWTGASVALMPAFSASGFLPAAARHSATCASLFAAPIRMILARGGPSGGLRLRHCWYAQNIAADQYETVAGWFGCRPRQLYGMTETIPAVLTDEAADPHHASMGRVSAGCAVDVQDAAGSSVEPGAVGEVVVGGEPGITLFAGYLDAPDITAASFRDGWFLTGDRAVRDDTGRHYFDGRRSDVLKVSGENVSIVEVESTLAEHPAVLEAAVVGRPDEIRDEVPVAFVVAADPSAPPSVSELDAWCAERLAKAKRPVVIALIDELPRTSVGKIRKFLLTEKAAARPG